MTAPTHPTVTRAHEVSAPRVLAPKRKATVRQVASTILASIAVAFVLSALVCLLPENPYQRWQLQANYMDGVLVRDYERIRFDPKPIDIVILGSSHAQLGLSAAAVEDQLALHGKRASVANLAIGGPGQNIQWAIVDQLFKSKSPKVIVIGVDDQPQLFGHFAFRYVAPAGAVVFPPTPFLHNYLYDLAYLPARKAQLFGAELFPTLFGLPKQFDPKAYAGKRSDYTTDFPDEFGKTVDMMHPVSRATLLAQQRRPDGRTFVARALNRISGGEDHLYIQKIAEKARAHGTQLIFIYIPIFNGPATISDRAFLEQDGQVLEPRRLGAAGRTVRELGALQSRRGDDGERPARGCDRRPRLLRPLRKPGLNGRVFQFQPQPSPHTSRLCALAAAMKLANSGWGSNGRDLSSGWNWTPINHG